jgi:hypothetical protein
MIVGRLLACVCGDFKEKTVNKHLTGNKLDASRYDKLWDILQSEPPRAAAIISAAYIDNLLDEILKRRLVDEGEFRKIGNLTFSRRISLCYLIGAFSKEIKEDLDLIEKIRNYFAHDIEINSFDERKIADKCRELKYISYLKKGLTIFPRFDDKHIFGPRDRFVIASTSYMNILLMRIMSIEKLEEGPKAWREQ